MYPNRYQSKARKKRAAWKKGHKDPKEALPRLYEQRPSEEKKASILKTRNEKVNWLTMKGKKLNVL